MKLIYIFFAFVLFSFANVNFSSEQNAASAKDDFETFGSCPAPIKLKAVLNGTNLTLTWEGPLSQYNYGGYLNPTGTFSGTTGGNQITITVPAGTTGGTFRVTNLCGDGSFSVSPPASF